MPIPPNVKVLYLNAPEDNHRLLYRFVWSDWEIKLKTNVSASHRAYNWSASTNIEFIQQVNQRSPHHLLMFYFLNSVDRWEEQKLNLDAQQMVVAAFNNGLKADLMLLAPSGAVMCIDLVSMVGKFEKVFGHHKLHHVFSSFEHYLLRWFEAGEPPVEPNTALAAPLNDYGLLAVASHYN